jgi:protein-disulfide isomerase
MSDGEIVKLKNTVSARDHVAGPLSAPVTLLEYGNFECIHCGRVYPVIKEVQKLLGGNLCFIFRHFPTVRTHPHSLRAAEAAEAAGTQDRFWEMHDELFTHQRLLFQSLQWLVPSLRPSLPTVGTIRRCRLCRLCSQLPYCRGEFF